MFIKMMQNDIYYNTICNYINNNDIDKLKDVKYNFNYHIQNELLLKKALTQNNDYITKILINNMVSKDTFGRIRNYVIIIIQNNIDMLKYLFDEHRWIEHLHLTDNKLLYDTINHLMTNNNSWNIGINYLLKIDDFMDFYENRFSDILKWNTISQKMLLENYLYDNIDIITNAELIDELVKYDLSKPLLKISETLKVYYMKCNVKYCKSKIVKDWIKTGETEQYPPNIETIYELETYMKYLQEYIKEGHSKYYSSELAIYRLLLKNTQHLWKDINNSEVLNILATTKNKQTYQLLKQIVNKIEDQNLNINIIQVARYGSFNVFKYLFNKMLNVDINITENYNYYVVNIVLVSLLNSDIRILKHIMRNNSKINEDNKKLVHENVSKVLFYRYSRLPEKYIMLKLKVLDKYYKFDINDVIRNVENIDFMITILNNYDGRLNHMPYLKNPTPEQMKQIFNILVYENKINYECFDILSLIYYYMKICGACLFSDKILNLMLKIRVIYGITIKKIIKHMVNSIFFIKAISFFKKITYKEPIISFDSFLYTELYITNKKKLIEYVGSYISDIHLINISIQTEQFTNWLKVRYYLIRFVKKRYKKYKLEHKNKYKTVYEDILYIPPNEKQKIKLLRYGGTEYRKIYNKNKCFYNKGFERVIPKHITKETLLYICKNKSKYVYSPKADGIYSKINLEDDLEQFVEAEYINGKYYIFNICNYNQNIFEKMEYLSTLQTMHQIKHQIKKIYKIVNERDFLEKLDTKPNTDYKTDGWIITSTDCKEVYKYKQKEHLTIDLLYKNDCYISKEDIVIENVEEVKNDNGIYRCYWNNGLWKPVEKRLEKKYANPIKVIKLIEDIHNNYWKSSDLIYLDKKYYHNVRKNNLSPNIKQYLKIQTNITKEWIRKYYFKGKVLDIGCGFGKKVEGIDDIYGIDINPECIHTLRIKYPNGNWSMVDFNYNWRDIFMENFDLVIANMSIHNYKNEVLFEEINKRTKKGTKMLVSLIDYELVKNGNVLLEFIKFIDVNRVKIKYPWNNSEIIEKILYLDNLITILKQYDWYLVEEFKWNDDYALVYSLREFVNCHRRLCFERK